MMSRLSVTFKGKTFHDYDREMDEYRKRHELWRAQMKAENTGFFPVFSADFKPYLDRLSGNALKLYLFLGFHIDNKTGECTVSLEHIAHHFGAKMRTVQGWMQELTDAKLVARVQTGYRNKSRTFFLPYGTITITEQ